jgi:hypothetical protein
MKKWLYVTLSVAIIILALFLRLYKIENRAPFDWDQNRDYQAVSDIAGGHATLVGPVAKGDGGFFLGPLYYYLLLPGYILMSGNPLALPATSAIMDVLAIVAILILIPKVWGRPQALILASIWSVSWFAIEGAKISWNVSLIPLWTVFFLYLFTSKPPLSLAKALLFGLLSGLTWHVHAALIPLVLLVMILYFRSLKFTWKTGLLFGVGYLTPLLPLFIFDLRHVGLEHRLILDYFIARNLVTPAWGQVFISVFSRLGKNTYSILLGQSNLHLWWGVGTTILALIGLWKGSRVAKGASAIMLLNVLLTLYFRDPGFPEYYLAASYLTMLILGIDLLPRLAPRMGNILLILVTCYLVLVNLRIFTTHPTSFSLSQKIAVAHSISPLGKSINIRYDLPLGRDAGLIPLLTRSGIVQNYQAKTQVVVTESTNTSVFIGGEIAKDLGWFGGFRVAYRVVQ